MQILMNVFGDDFEEEKVDEIITEVMDKAHKLSIIGEARPSINDMDSEWEKGDDEQAENFIN